MYLPACKEQVRHSGAVVHEELRGGDGLYAGVIVMEPALVAGMVNIANIVALGGLFTVMVNNANELILALLGADLAPALGHEFLGDVEVNGDGDVFGDFLETAFLRVNEPLQLQSQHLRELFEEPLVADGKLLSGVVASVAGHFGLAQALLQSVLDAGDLLVLDVQRQGDERLQISGLLTVAFLDHRPGIVSEYKKQVFFSLKKKLNKKQK